MARLMTTHPYRLPDGRIVQLDEDVTKGDFIVTYTLANGRIVDAVRCATFKGFSLCADR